MRAGLTLVALLAGCLPTAANAQELTTEQAQCFGEDEAISLEMRIDVCTTLILAEAQPRQAAFLLGGRGSAYAQLGDLPKALADFDEAVRIQPDLYIGYYARGALRISQGDHRGAYADFSEAIRLEPDLPQAAQWHDYRGRLALELGEYEVALLDFSALIAGNASDAEAFANRGWAYHWLDRAELAVADFTSAIQLRGGVASDWHGRCRARLRLETQTLTALSDCEEFLRLEPNNPYAHASRGQAYLKNRRWNVAEADFTHALVLMPDYASALFGRAIARAALGQRELAEADLADAMRLDPAIAEGYKPMGLKYVPSL